MQNVTKKTRIRNSRRLIEPQHVICSKKVIQRNNLGDGKMTKGQHNEKKLFTDIKLLLNDIKR